MATHLRVLSMKVLKTQMPGTPTPTFPHRIPKLDAQRQRVSSDAFYAFRLSLALASSETLERSEPYHPDTHFTAGGAHCGEDRRQQTKEGKVVGGAHAISAWTWD